MGSPSPALHTHDDSAPGDGSVSVTRLAQGGQDGTTPRVTQGSAQRLPSLLVQQTRRAPTQGRSLACLRPGEVSLSPPESRSLTLPRPSTDIGDQETVPGSCALTPLPWAALTLAQEWPQPSAPRWLSDPLLLAWLTAGRGEP